ncbi:MAG: response regulator [Myxococcales bacterium]|nr:response regulator [Myxococcales bacterium]
MDERAREASDTPAPAELRANPVSSETMADLYTLSVSLDSMVIPCDRDLPVGSVVNITVKGRGGLPDMAAVGRVSAVLEADVGRGRRPGVRVQLLEVRPGRAELLASIEPAAPEAARILVVDDDDLMRREAEHAMRGAGHEVITARNGVEALSIALSEPIDLVLTDVTMPSMDGWQLLRLLRSRAKLSKLPVIFLTRLTSDVERLKGYELGVSDYVDKPFHVDDLVERVRVQLASGTNVLPSDALQVLRGDLAQVALASLLSLIEMERRTGVLRLQREGEQAVLYIRRGSVVSIDLDVRHAAKQGMERFFHVLDWHAGSFELNAVSVERSADLEITTTHALLAHAESRDEQAHAAEPL